MPQALSIVTGGVLLFSNEQLVYIIFYWLEAAALIVTDSLLLDSHIEKHINTLCTFLVTKVSNKTLWFSITSCLPSFTYHTSVLYVH